MVARKPDDQRVRRNKPLKVELGVPGEIPVLPEWAGRSVAAREWWATVWADPISTIWRSSDHASLARLAMLHGEVAAGVLEDSKLLSEIRALEDRFYLNPRARRIGGIVMPDVAEKPVEVEVPAAADRRRSLKVV